MKVKTLAFICLLGCGLFLPGAQGADDPFTAVALAPLNSSRIVLEIQTPSGLTSYTLNQLESLGLKQMITETYWPEDNGVYQGVLLKDLLAQAGIGQTESITLTALDDYTTRIPRQDWEKWPVLLATRKDGKAMSVRQKGPTRIIYPKYMGGEVAESPMRIRWIWAIKQIAPAD